MNHERFDGLGRTLAGASSRRQALKLLGGGAAAGALAVTGLRDASAQRGSKENPLRNLELTGTATGGEEFEGILKVKRFAVEDNVLYVVGQLKGTVDGDPIRPQNVSIPVEAINGVDLSGGAAAGRVRAQATCEILNLTLGPLDLDLLGLVIELDQINLRITAESGPGNLLGNLLCAITGLLDGFDLGDLLDLAGLLNRLLRLLQRL